MRVIVIGGTGHIGTYLIPALVKAKHEVYCVSRNKGKPYTSDVAWEKVKHVHIDRTEAEQNNDFGQQILDLAGDVVIDLICFTPESAAQLTTALVGNISHFIHCGSMWVHGYSEFVPTTESQERKPFGAYGIMKAKIEDHLREQYLQNGFPSTVLHPGHITGPGWLPINPAGNLNPEVFTKLSKGQNVDLPNFGLEALHHVHAEDVAQAFVNTITYKEKSVGESFHVVSEQAMTLRGYAEAIASWFGKEANLSFVPWEDWKALNSQTDADLTYDHIAHSPNGSISKAKKLINFRPKYSALDAAKEAIQHYLQSK